jgi:(p)ppGpp synthase/HD superfamily hydrolase
MDDNAPNKPFLSEAEEGERIVKVAKHMATHAHKGVNRRDGQPYISHCEAVVNKFHKSAYYYRAVAWIHDTIEDTDITTGYLYQTFPDIVADAVMAMTHNKHLGETYLDYLLKVSKNAIAKAVKLADLEHNLGTSVNGNQREKYIMAVYILKKAS